jgi:ligand-binding SRPBCC domain-containing protein
MMKIYRLEQKLILPITKTECWKFYSDPRNLGKITPPDMDFTIQSELPAAMHAGQIIMYGIKILPGVKLNWVTEITHVLENKYFVDEQRFGPYKFWHHQHLFKEVENGMEIQDIVHYAIPFGILGRLANTVFIRSRLNKIFRYRKDYIKSIYEQKQ